MRIYRHTLPVRLGHWLNVLCLLILIMSGLQIFNAHPALYWGDRSDRDRPLLSMRAVMTESGERRGIMTVLGLPFDTTGLFGYSSETRRGFPSWATLPGPQWLAMGRRWHLFFAWVFVINGIIFTAYGVISRHFKKDLVPTGQDLKGIPQAVKDHLVFRHPKGDEAKRYNVLQKLAYVGVIFGLAPLIVLTGLTMSPTIDTAFPWLLTIFGGRQAARTIHFIACFSFVGFILIHVSQVVLTGFFNNMRSMITGWFVVKRETAMKRRQFLKGTLGAASLVALAGCDNLTQSRWFPGVLNKAEKLTDLVQRAITPAGALAKEYSEADISAVFPANGNIDPGTQDYAEMAQNNFAEWDVMIDGLVATPMLFSLAAIKEMPARTQVTRHDCVEGWSAIGKWTGVPLGDLMRRVEPLSNAKYAVFHCADVDDEGVLYYESMALADCYHPQTILAYELNGRPLDIPHGAPLRLRFERQLGYKQAKYVERIELVESLAGIGGGKGGYWEDQGYEWYAGI